MGIILFTALTFGTMMAYSAVLEESSSHLDKKLAEPPYSSTNLGRFRPHISTPRFFTFHVLNFELSTSNKEAQKVLISLLFASSNISRILYPSISIEYKSTSSTS
jgi:hypothetical protein